MIQHGDSIQPQENQKVIIQGYPKDSGKSTFAISAAVNHGPLLDLQYDLGNPTIPPGVDPASVYVKTYEPASPIIPKKRVLGADKKMVETGEYNFATDRWTPPTNLGESMLQDIIEVREAFVQRRPILLDNGAGDKIEIPLPRTLVLDGAVGLVQGVMDWIFAVNNAVEVDDFVGSSGKVNKYRPWQKRNAKLITLFNMVIPLPCNIILITWSAPEMKDDQLTGRYLPDIGGKLDIQGAGKFDSSIRCYSKQTASGTRYYVSYRGGEMYPGLGIRNRYDTGADIDVTIEKGKPLPYDRVFPLRV